MKYCLLGEKLSHSFSRILHESLGARYALEEVEREKLGEFVLNSDYDGFNVTIPYKKQIIPYLDALSDLAKRLGAVNTVKCENGKMSGYNTDYYGFLQTLKTHGVAVEGKTAMVLGSGGASATAVAALEDLGAKNVVVVSRKGETNYSNCYGVKDVSVIVNATPVGTFPDYDSAPVDLERFSGIEFVFDLVYNPFRTKLLTVAEKLGVPHANGAEMLIYQALFSREIWTGEPVSDDNAKKCLAAIKNSTVNIALVGMPSSGKSTVGKIIAEKLGKNFSDTDGEVFSLSGKTPESIIVERGESEFRKVESVALKNCLSRCGSVVATGGGAILSPENRRILKQTSFVVYIKRDLDKLVSDGRPLSKKIGVEELFKERAPLYEFVADLIVENNGGIEEVAERIVKGYEDFGY